MTQLDEATQAPVKLGRKRDHSRDPEILDAALEVLAETGYEGMTIDLVAARAKAGKATLYRRWSSKGELVIDAIGCMKQRHLDETPIPDTGTLRGDLVGMIKPDAIDDSERKLRIMSGLMSMLAHSPELADAAVASFVEPRAAVNRLLLRRAVDRGEVSPDIDIELISTSSQAIAIFRVLVQRKPLDRKFLISIIDGVVLPAVGIRPPAA